MSDIRFNQWLHQSGTGGVSQDHIGNIGIGTTNPSIVVSAANTAVLNVGVITANNLFVNNAFNGDITGNVTGNISGATGTFSGNVDIADKIIHTGDTDTAMRFPADNTFAVDTAGTERFRIRSDGRVTIGTQTINTNSMLSIHRSSSDESQIRFTNTTTGEGGNNGLLVGIDSNEHGRIFNQENSPLRFGTNNTERLRITSGGQVIIGDSASDLSGTHTFMACGAYHAFQRDGNTGTYLSIGLGAANGTVDLEADARSGGYPDMRFITTNTERFRITSGGDVLIGGQTAYTYDDTGDSNTILDIWNSGNNKRGILSLSGNTNAGASIGTIWFNNDNNSGASPGNNMKLSAAIQAQAVTTDGNAGDDAGARLQFLTKPESSPMTDSMIISGEGYVTKPRQPAFRAGRSSNYTPGAGSDIIFDTVSGGGKHNVGNHYNTSNGRFTAPVAGVYTFTIHVIWMNLSSGQNMADCFHPKINGTVVGYSGQRAEYIANTTGNGGYYADFMTYQYTLAAGDYVTVNNQFNLTIHGNSNYTTFSGHLVC